jgi:hypothetical protein
VYKGVTKLWEDCVYPNGEVEGWHKWDCLMGECAKCGVGQVPICPNKCFAYGSWAMAWKCFEQDIILRMIDEGRPKKCLKKHSRKLQLICF